MRKFTVLSIILLSLISLTYGYSVTLIVAQNDSTQNGIRLTTRAVEDSLLNSFFDIGAIVSNEPIITDSQDSGQLRKEIAFAAAGGFDYILHLTIQYKPQPSANLVGLVLSDITGFRWELFKSDGVKKLAEGTFVPPANLAKVTGKKESESAIKKICDAIRTEVNSAIAKTGGSK